MKMLQALSAHILDNTCLKRENIHSTADNGEVIISGQDMGQGYEVCRFKYDAIIELERFKGDARDITALVAGWLIDNDEDREHLGLADPEINATLNDGKTADVDITVEFNESIQIVEDDKGSIVAWGKRWRVQDVPVDVATDLVNLKGAADEL